MPLPYDSRAVLLYDLRGNPLAVRNGLVLPADQPTLMVSGSTGALAQTIFVDGFGRQVCIGATPDGSAVIDNPFLAAAKDGANIARIVRSDPTGRIELAPAAVPTYAASTNGTVATGLPATTVTSTAFLFHPGASPKRVEIVSIQVSWASGSVGRFSIRGCFITADNGGGVSETINPLDRADPATGMTFRTGGAAPTRVAGDLFCISASPGANQVSIIEPRIVGKQITLRQGVAEGFEIRTVVEEAITTASQLSVDFVWREFTP